MTQSVIPETGEKCGRHYMFTDEECVIVSTYLLKLKEQKICCTQSRVYQAHNICCKTYMDQIVIDTGSASFNYIKKK